MSALKQLIVNQTPVRDIDQESITVREAIRAAGLDPAACDVFLLENEGDQGTKVSLDHVLNLAKADGGKPVRLRCVPSDRSVG